MLIGVIIVLYVYFFSVTVTPANVAFFDPFNPPKSRSWVTELRISLF